MDMPMRLPPLNALRAFEAAARHGGFIAAADELCVTRGAISRHVKLLEQHLGCTLFHRNAAGVELAPAGKRLLPVLTDAFTRIAAESQRLKQDERTLSVLCPPASSVRWLMPRMGAFRAAHPDIRLRLTTDFHGSGPFELSDYDLGISVQNWPNRSPSLKVAPFMPCLVTPAASPDLARRLTNPSDLGSETLLREAPFGRDWEDWLGHFDVTGVDAARAQVFSNLDIAVQAARMGEGVVMVDHIMCREEIRSGALVLPFPDMICPTRYGDFAVIGPPDRWDDPDVTVFREWIAAEGAKERTWLAGLLD